MFSWSEDVDLADYSDLTLPPSPLPSPEPGAVVGDWTSSLGTLADVLGKAATTVSGILGARDAAADKLDARQYDRAVRAQQMDMQRAALGANAELGRLGLQAQIARAQNELRGLTSGQSTGGLLTLALIAGGAWLLAKGGKP